MKSGRDYTIHSALNKLLSNTDYHIKSAIVVSNERIVRQVGNVKYLPIYYIMFLDKEDMGSEEVFFWKYRRGNTNVLNSIKLLELQKVEHMRNLNN